MDFLLHLAWSIVIGFLAGWLAGHIKKGSGYGIFGNIVVGILGSLVGSLLCWLTGFSAQSTIASIISATVGALLLLTVLPKIR